MKSTSARLLFDNQKLKAAKVRHASDYDEFYIASKAEAEKQIQTAELLIREVEKYVSQQ